MCGSDKNPQCHKDSQVCVICLEPLFRVADSCDNCAPAISTHSLTGVSHLRCLTELTACSPLPRSLLLSELPLSGCRLHLGLPVSLHPSLVDSAPQVHPLLPTTVTLVQEHHLKPDNCHGLRVVSRDPVLVSTAHSAHSSRGSFSNGSQLLHTPPEASRVTSYCSYSTFLLHARPPWGCLHVVSWWFLPRLPVSEAWPLSASSVHLASPQSQMPRSRHCAYICTRWFSPPAISPATVRSARQGL